VLEKRTSGQLHSLGHSKVSNKGGSSTEISKRSIKIKHFYRFHPTIDTKSDRYWVEEWETSDVQCISCGKKSVWESVDGWSDSTGSSICINCGQHFLVEDYGKLTEKDSEYSVLIQLKELK